MIQVCDRWLVVMTLGREQAETLRVDASVAEQAVRQYNAGSEQRLAFQHRDGVATFDMNSIVGLVVRPIK